MAGTALHIYSPGTAIELSLHQYISNRHRLFTNIDSNILICGDKGTKKKMDNNGARLRMLWEPEKWSCIVSCTAHRFILQLNRTLKI